MPLMLGIFQSYRRLLDASTAKAAIVSTGSNTASAVMRANA
jgi:hypothetical protein